MVSRIARVFNIHGNHLDATDAGEKSKSEKSRRRRVLQLVRRHHRSPAPPLPKFPATDTKRREEIYQPLSVEKQEIRLLDLYPGNSDDVVRCKLRIVSLISDTPPRYETTSYAWGDANIHDHVIINNISTAVTASSAAVLRRCRDERNIRTLWIDAICIDQTELGERNQQITLMASIYRQCWRNIIYLGEPATPVRGAEATTLTQALDDLIQHKMRHMNLDSIEALEKYLWVGNIADIFADSARNPPKNRDFLVKLINQTLPVFKAVWFQRLWVIQESILPSDNICYWVAESIPLRTLLLAAQCIMSWEENLPKGVDRIIYAAYILHLYTVIYAEPWPDHGELLGALLGHSEHLQVTIKHDHLYGLLGLFQAASELQDLPELLRPDYGRSWTVVLADATKFILRERRSLHSLNNVEHSASSVDELTLPSWVACHPENDSLGALDGSGKFSASGGTVYEPNLDDKWNELTVKGYIIGLVSETAPTQDDPTSPDSMLKTYRTASNMAARSTYDGVLTDSIQEAVAYTLVGGKTWERQRVEGSYSETCKHTMAQTELWTAQPPLELAAATQDPDGGSVEAARYAYAMWEVVPQRTLFCTDSSHFGLGPPYTTSNDVLAILIGYHLPVILRPVEGHGYRYVGPCYVHGIMDAEVVRQRKADNIPSELLVLV